MGVQKLSTKNQIVLPKEARQAMNVRGGDELLVVVKGDVTVIMPNPRNYTAALHGMGGKIYPRDYLEKERRAWK